MSLFEPFDVGLFPKLENKEEVSKMEAKVPEPKKTTQIISARSAKQLPKLGTGIKTTSIKKILSMGEGLQGEEDNTDGVELEEPRRADLPQKQFTAEELKKAWSSIADMFDTVSVKSVIENSVLKIDENNKNKIIIEVASSVQKHDLKDLIVDIADNIRKLLHNEYVIFDFSVREAKQTTEKKATVLSDEEILKRMMLKNKNLFNFCKKYQLRVKDN